jgi:Protein of unknown function (DUF3987)/CHC2 zinc finger
MADSAITFTSGEVSTYYAARVPHLKQRRAAEWRGPCPIHHGKNDNFAVDPETGRWFCHSACGRGGDILELEAALAGGDFPTRKAEVFGLVGRVETPPKPAARRIVTTYAYRDEAGKLLFEVVRFDPKGFAQRRPDGRGGWVWNLEGVRLVPYRLPQLLRSKWAFVVEGEKDADALARWNLVATCNPMGAGKWRPDYSEHLRGRRVAVIPDNDAPGRRHAAAVAESLLAVGVETRILELPAGKDVSEWAEAGPGTREELLKLSKAASVLTTAALAEWRARWEQNQQPAAAVADEWPDPLPLGGELPPVEKLTPEMLPASFRRFVADVAERMQVPADFPAAAMVVSLAGAVNRRAQIQPKALDSGWKVVPNLWGGLVGRPGYKKSPVIEAITKPLRAIQDAWFREHEAVLEDIERERELHSLRLNAWKQQATLALKKGRSEPERPPDEPTTPTCKRLIVVDATVEAFHKAMSENPAGILVLRDELTGWLAQLERPGRESERAFCLEAWNGTNGFTMDRVGRGRVHCEHVCMSLLGGIQPGRLRSYLGDALAGGPGDDGLIQRFQVLVWPDLPADWRLVDRKPDAQAEETAATVLQSLVDLPAGDPPALFRFARDAQELFFEWYANLQGRLRAGNLHEALVAHLSKYGSLMPSLALLFELADQAATGGFDSEDVGLDHARQAATWCDYLESHSRRVYSSVVSPQMRAATALAERVKRREVGPEGTFALRDIYRAGWSDLDTPAAARAAVSMLEDLDWVREIPAERSDRPGRPLAARFSINPKVRGAA